MRLLVLGSRDRRNPNSAGGDLVLSEISERLGSRGIAVTYVCSGFKGALPEENVRGVRVIRLGSIWTASLRALIFYVKNHGRFDAVVQEVMGGLRIPYFAPLYVRKPFVGVWYQRNHLVFRFQYNETAANLLKPLEYILARIHRSRLVLCLSRRTMTDLLHLGLTKNRTRLFVPGVDETILKLSEMAHASGRENLITWLGKIRRYKRTQDAILTMDRLVKMVPSSRLQVVGTPEDEKYMIELKQLRDRLHLNDHVSFKPRISEEEKGELLLRTKAVLVTSPIEGWSIVVSEANACGTPAVVTDGVPAESVLQNVNGIRVGFGDLDAMADACRMVLTDDNLFIRLSKASIECSKDRTWDRTADTFLCAINDAMKNGW